ncbi:MAG: hypothetical protein IJC83_00270 [Oscillospiraceae bacterium]|nr:hypothetical protein [Oscillospiraceae bacterium]
MSNSLLAHLYPKFTTGVENLATESLCYLLKQSNALNIAFTKLVSDLLKLDLQKTLQYSTQETIEENNARPDLVGKDRNGCDVLFCEMKFYAGLTQNQPLTYIDSLKSNGGSGLLFVCPKARETDLWKKLKDICDENKRNIKEVDNHLCIVDGIAMGIITWGEILEKLEQVCHSNDNKSLADVIQLKGLCEHMDMDRFIPFTSEELSAETARKIQRYYDVIDKTVELLEADKNINFSNIDGRKQKNVKSTRETERLKGYQKEFKIDNHLVYFAYDRQLWKSNSSIATPFWVSFNDENWESQEDIQNVFAKIDANKKDDDYEVWNVISLALVPPVNATLDEVCEDLKRQILNYLDLFKNN